MRGRRLSGEAVANNCRQISSRTEPCTTGCMIVCVRLQERLNSGPKTLIGVASMTETHTGTRKLDSAYLAMTFLRLRSEGWRRQEMRA